MTFRGCHGYDAAAMTIDFFGVMLQRSVFWSVYAKVSVLLLKRKFILTTVIPERVTV